MGLMGSIGSGLKALASSFALVPESPRYDGERLDLPETRGWNVRPGFAGSRNAYSGETVLGRARDLDRNNAWINGGLDRRVEAVVGGSIRLLAQPVAELLNRDFDWRMKWTADVQSRFRVWANDINFRCDARQKLHFGQIVRLAYLSYIRDGECAAEVRQDFRGLKNPINLLLFEAERISTPQDQAVMESPLLRDGIVFNPGGAAIGYWIRTRHPADPVPRTGMERWEYVPRFGKTGTAKLIHVFNPRYAEQNRGISRLVEAMIPATMLDRVDRAEVQAALKSAVLSFFIKSAGTPEDVAAMFSAPVDPTSSDYIDQYLDYRSDNPIQIDGADVHQLFPGEDAITPDANHPNSNYAIFAKYVLQKVASAIGVSYPQLSQDWAGINYSSARALLNELWRSFLQDRDYFTGQFCTPVYAAWLEWEVANGDVKVPGGPANFYRQMSAICMASWIGPGRGSVDPLKEANANNLDTAAGRKSTPQLILEDGRDPEDVLSEEAWWNDQRIARGLGTPNYNVKADAAGADEDGSSDQGGTEQDRDGDGVPMEDTTTKGGKKKGAGK